MLFLLSRQRTYRALGQQTIKNVTRVAPSIGAEADPHLPGS